MSTPATATRLRSFGTSIFAEITQLATEHGAVNLSQGFPDFDSPEFLKQAARHAIIVGNNQYARTQGMPRLNEAIAGWFRRFGGRPVDPHDEITVTSGCTEALAACCLGLLEPGDEVVVFEPYYDAYLPDLAMAGAVPRFVTLHAETDGSFAIQEDELRAAFGARTRAVILNTPHNPTGKVFSREELAMIAALCIEHDAIVIADEVYERLTYDPDKPHISIATLPGMAERTVVLSSLGKTFSVTGWKIGWAIAPPHLTAGVRAAHQFLTYATSTPLQHAAADALSGVKAQAYVTELTALYADRRRFLCDELRDLGFGVNEPEGTYFIMADHTAISERLGLSGDIEFCRWLTTEAGVATIPPSVFYTNKAEGERLLRFAFCKRQKTLYAAIWRMRRALT